MKLASGAMQRRRLRVRGVVQGVGFRPATYRLASELALSGWVGNDSSGVVIEVEGDPAALDTFAARLVSEQPPLARIDALETTVLATRGETGFAIRESSASGGARTLISPDVATCPACLSDVHDPANRRYRYPFTNCTDCGPRFTIIRDLPYDRPATTMAGFSMCAACAAEYRDPHDRRYHAQPIACPDCGPQLSFRRDGRVWAGTDAALAVAHAALANGEVVAVKGLGGFHLACDAANPAAVARLRERKGRPDKPFAVMAADLATAETLAEVDELARAALASPARPIVLLPRRDDAPLYLGVAPGNPLIGVMLPYTPLHHLLFQPVPGSPRRPPAVLVLTSGNRAEEPICHDDADAAVRLADLADAFLTHDRPIEVPCDDSVVRVVDGAVQPIRRSRGYAPLPIALPFAVPGTLGVGGELKNTCCVASGRSAWVSQHIGNMENLETLGTFERNAEALTRMYGVEVRRYGTDLHPGYLTRTWALDHAGDAVVDVQHHHAHVAALMAEHGLEGDKPLLAFAFDGTGYGYDDSGAPQMWGGEALLADYTGFSRIAHLLPFPLPGGDAGVRNPCRIALAALVSWGIPCDERIPSFAACDATERAVVTRQVERGFGCVPTTSMGRLFDVVASLLGVRHRITYEAQAAIELEALAETHRGEPLPLAFQVLADGTIDSRVVIADLVTGLGAGQLAAALAFSFHAAAAAMVRDVAIRHREEGYGGPIGLTGGVFQNSLLTGLTRRALNAAGFEVLTHRLLPANDGGLSLGQAVIAGARDAARDGTE